MEHTSIAADLRMAGASETENANVQAVFQAIAKGVARIARSNAIGAPNASRATSTANTFGDVQLEGDLLAEGCIVSELASCPHVSIYSSEETPEDKTLNESGEYAVAFDPLDGSSIIGSNFSVGSIFAIFKPPTPGTFIGVSGDDMVGAAYAVYGPRTVLVVAYETRLGCDRLGDSASTKVVKEYVLNNTQWLEGTMRTLCDSKKLMAPANLRASADNDAYRLVVHRWMADGYTLRYTGGMVPDIHNLLVKGGGVFCNPISPTAPAKLRLLYECLPFAYIIESAWGRAITTNNKRLMELVVRNHDDRAPICLGSPTQVDMSKDCFF